jgi:AraC family transcriptional regulator of adaptative response/methylated-DNA-[protein]-cysteine methyltransferase
MIKITKIKTPLGEMIAGATKDGICLLEFSDRENLSVEYEELAKLFNTTIKTGFNLHFWALRKQLRSISGEKGRFSLSGWLLPVPIFRRQYGKNSGIFPLGKQFHIRSRLLP